MEKRVIIKYGYRWMRFIFLLIAFFIVLEIISTSQDRILNFAYLMIYVMLFLLFRLSRRLQFDSKNFYIIRGNNEKIIPFISIISIKKSSSKVNGGRYWKMLYQDEFKTEHICRYFPTLDTKKLNESVKKVNPNVVIWEHPFFNH